MQTIQPSFSKGEIASTLYGRVDTAAYQVALKKAENVYVHAAGGFSNRPGTSFKGFAASMSITSRIRKFQFKATDTYLLEFGHLLMRVMRQGGYVLEAAKAITGLATLPLSTRVTSASHGFSAGDRVYISGLSTVPQLDGRYFDVAPSPTTNTLELADPMTGVLMTDFDLSGYVGGGSIARVYTLTTPYTSDHLPDLKFSQSADIMTITHNLYAVKRLSRSGHASWSLDAPVYTPGIAAPGSFAGAGVITGTDDVYYKITATLATTAEESLAASATVTDSASAPYSASNFLKNSLTWAAVTGASKYSLYRSVGGVFGLIGESDTTSFLDDNLAPDLGIAPPEARDPLTGSGNYPGCSAYFEQRQVFGGSVDNPDTSYYTRTGNFNSFSVSSPIQDDDAITATLTSGEVNEIRHFVAGNDLLVFTGGAEWKVSAGSDSPFTPATIRQKPQSSWGCSNLQPLVIGNTVLFVQDTNISVRSIGYSVQADGYVGTDMTKLVPHFFGAHTIRDFAFLRSPEPLVLAVRTDGQVCVLTFDQEQEVLGWTRWKTSGKVEAVAVVRENATDPDDTIYFVVQRTVNGATVRFIESVASRRFESVEDCFFVDSGVTHDEPITIEGVSAANPAVVTAAAHGLSTGDYVDISDILWVSDVSTTGTETQPDQLNGRRYTVTVLTSSTFSLDGADGSAFNAYVEGGYARVPVSTVHGLGHLEGRTVTALGDGNVLSDQTVAGGMVTFPRAYSRIHVGLPYTAEAVTLTPLAQGVGVKEGVPRKVPEVAIRFDSSRGLLMGTSETAMYELKQREFEPYGAPTDLLTGLKKFTLSSDWAAEENLILRQIYPLPMTIVSLSPTKEGLR